MIYERFLNRRRGGSVWPPACSPPQNVSPSLRRGGACPSRRISEMAVVRRRGGTLACPSSADHDVRRARRLGAPPRRVSPCGASFFPSDGKETKGSPGETHIAVGNRSPPAPVRSPPDPRLRGIPLYPSAGVPARRIRFPVLIFSGPLGPGAVQNFGWYDFTAAPGSDQPWQRVQNWGADPSTMAAAGGPQRKAQRSGFALERRSAESSRPTDVMVYGGRAARCPAPTAFLGSLKWRKKHSTPPAF